MKFYTPEEMLKAAGKKDSCLYKDLYYYRHSERIRNLTFKFFIVVVNSTTIEE